MVTLDFYIPAVGYVSAALHNEAETIYKWLEKTGEVERLKRLDHLGAVRLAWEGAHHPRWEYVVFLAYLIDRTREVVPDVHLGSTVRLLSGDEVSSGSELLKSWALLLNVGHLVWTFFAERALLLELWANRVRRGEFIGRFAANSSLKKWVEQILKRGDIYRFYQALCFIRLEGLESLETDMSSSGTRVLWRPILEQYLLDDNIGSPVVRLRDVYRRLRRLAYLILDTHYTPAGLQLRAIDFLSHQDLLASVVVGEPPASEAALKELERLLSRKVYLGERVIAAIAARETAFRRQIRQKLRIDGLNSTVEWLAKPGFEETIQAAALDRVARLQVFVEEPFDGLIPGNRNARMEQAKLESRLLGRDRQKAVCLFWPAAVGPSGVAQFHGPRGERESWGAVYRVAFDYAAGLRGTASKWEKWLKETTLQNLLFEELAAELIIGALRLLTERDLRWEWERVLGEPVAILTTKKNALRYLAGMTQNERRMSAAGEWKARMAEVKGAELVLKMTSRKRGFAPVAVAVGRLVGYRGKDQRIELDGCIVRPEGKGGVKITIIEAKSGKKAVEKQARDQLERALEELNCSYDGIHSKKLQGIGVAWVSINVSGD